MLDDCTYVHFSPQLEKSRTGTSVSINSTAVRPSGWAVPCILVYINIYSVRVILAKEGYQRLFDTVNSDDILSFLRDIRLYSSM